MRRYLIHAYALLGALLTAACIDKYDADLPDSDGNLLVVEGTIRSDELCTFYLSRSTELKDSRYSFELYVSQANISVQGDDGQVFNGSVLSGGSYRIPVGHLSPDHHYWLRIETDGLVFTSEPQAPLYSDPIDTLTFRQDPSDLEVDVMLTSVAPSDGTTKYYRWNFDEYWEVITPYIAQYEYFPPSDALISGREDPGYIAEATPPKYHGWAHRQDRACVLGCTDDFIDGRIFNTLLSSIPSTDDRLSNLYCTRVRQRNISKQEYEYEMLRRKLSSEMGGLFTPMPSELPTNIRCENGDRGVIGYVGVSGEGSVAVSLDEASSWSLTADSWVSSFEGSLLQVSANGYHLYVNGEMAL